MKKNGFAAEVRAASAFGDFLRDQDSQWHKVIVGANVGATSIADTKAKSHDPGPWAIPTALGILVGLGTVFHVVRRKRANIASAHDNAIQGSSTKMSGTVAAFAVYLLAMPYIGFFTSTSLISVAAIHRLGRGWGSAISATIIIMGAVYLLFIKLFRVPLPTGALF
jgi:hypothetical protein